MTSASVAVIGGGVIGASVAYHLAARGWRDVVILDRGRGPGEGSTGRATGGYRAQYATPINVRLSLLAREKLCRFQADTGVDPGYCPAGYLWLGADETEMAELRAGQRVQHGPGLREAVEVDPAEVARLNPALARDSIAGGVFCPTDGFIRPLGLLEGYLAAARRLGVRVEWGTEATGVSRRPDGTISAVHTSSGPIGVAAVVNAAGPWAAPVAGWAGIGAAGRAAQAAGGGDGAVRPAARVDADDDLRGRRLPSPGAGRPGAPAVAHAGRRGPSVRSSGGSGVGAPGDRDGPPAGAGAARRRDRPRGLLGGALRDVARPVMPSSAPRPAAPISSW